MVFRTPRAHALAADRPVLRGGVFSVPTRIIRIDSFDSPNADIEGRLVGAQDAGFQRCRRVILV